MLYIYIFITTIKYMFIQVFKTDLISRSDFLMSYAFPAACGEGTIIIYRYVSKRHHHFGGCLSGC